MMRQMLVALLLGLSACATPSTPRPIAHAAPTDVRAPVTILVSIDAFRPDYLYRGDTPNLDALARGGAQGSMRPSFPTLTFPNHEAMITGMYPDHSGIVAGEMFDARRPDVRFTNKNQAEATDPFWWAGAEPLWISAERAGIATGVMFWPGVEAEHDGKRPGDWARYDANYTGAQRVRTLLDWMRRPAENRPKFGIVYLDIVDKTAHKQGPTAPATLAAVREADGWIGALVAGLKSLGQPANIVVVSDHGMRDIDPAKSVLLETLLPKQAFRWVQWGPFGAIDALPGHEAEVAAVLLRPNPLMQCWRKGDVPARFHYGRNARVAQFICLGVPGAEVVPVPPTNKGDHGYDPDDPLMSGTIIVNGPAFRAGARAPTKFDNVDVYPLLRHLIGLPPVTAVDGTITPLLPLLKD